MAGTSWRATSPSAKTRTANRHVQEFVRSPSTSTAHPRLASPAARSPAASSTRARPSTPSRTATSSPSSWPEKLVAWRHLEQQTLRPRRPPRPSPKRWAASRKLRQSPSGFGQDLDGELYMCDLEGRAHLQDRAVISFPRINRTSSRALPRPGVSLGAGGGGCCGCEWDGDWSPAWPAGLLPARRGHLHPRADQHPRQHAPDRHAQRMARRRGPLAAPSRCRLSLFAAGFVTVMPASLDPGSLDPLIPQSLDP